MTKRLLTPLAVLIALVCIPISRAQFTYAFDGTTETYFTYGSGGIGSLTDATLRNTYTTTGTSVSSDSGALIYKVTAPLNMNWTTTVSVSLPSGVSGVSELATDESVQIGINLVKDVEVDGSFYDFNLRVSNTDGGANERIIYSEYNSGYSGAGDQTLSTATALISANLSFDYVFDSEAGTGVVTAAYNGITLSSYDLLNGSTGWATTSAGSATVVISAVSSGIDSFGAPNPQFTNFSITAVPEPATMAFVLGAAAIIGVLLKRRSAQIG